MKIDLTKLQGMGFTVHYNKRELEIFPKSRNEELQARVNELCEYAGLNEAETDQAFSSLHKIFIMSAIRKASNW